jgi:ComF family protein
MATRASGIILNDLLNFIFPPECIVCENRLAEDEKYFCATCRNLADDIRFPVCPECRTEITDPRTGCSNCKGTNPISILWTCGTFDQFYRPVVHGIKYEGLLPLVSMMSDIIFSRLNETLGSSFIDAIVPVPLHWTRLRGRGFNQSEQIADELGRRLNRPVLANALKRVKKTLDQTGLSAQARIENMKGAFKIRDADAVAGRRILLIDDVTTTGATLNEAAGELRRAGCRNVYAAVIAMASYG